MAAIIDIPLHPIEIEDEKRCVQVMMSGERCAHEAVQHGRCDVHWEWVGTGFAREGMPLPEDSISLQVTLMKAMDMIMLDGIDPRKVAGIVELCKLMSQNVRAYQYERGDVVASVRRRRLRK